MSDLRPFRAVRPARERAAAVSSVPYDVVNTDEARRIAAGNPLSFLHVTRSEIDLPDGTDPYSAQVYDRAKKNFATLGREAPLVEEDTPSIYFYRLRMGGHEQTGVAGCFSLDEYDRDLIKKHERTRRDKEDDRTRHIIELRAQTGVVFLTYKASDDIDRFCRIVDAFTTVPALYIADGHHRAASAARARAELAVRGDAPEAASFIAVAFPDNQMQILAYNRIVKDLAAQTAHQFLDTLRRRVPVKPGSPTPAGKGEVSMFLDGGWYALDFSQAPPADGSRASALDVALLQQHVLEPLLQIGDVRTDKRIDFVGGARGTAALEAAVKDGRAAVAFSMHPVTIGDLMSISDEGGIMPPKSTWFEPKLRDGLLTHTL
jgi:uncharacterized protein (DUF1015 family)